MARFAPIYPATADNLGYERSYFRLPWQINNTFIIVAYPRIS